MLANRCKRSTEIQKVRSIQSEPFHSCPTDVAVTDDFGIISGPQKVFTPQIRPRIEKRHYLSRIGIARLDGARFRAVTPKATPCQIVELSQTTQYQRNDVIFAKRIRTKAFRRTAILASTASALTEKPPSIAPA
jgi:hypothetical protein